MTAAFSRLSTSSWPRRFLWCRISNSPSGRRPRVCCGHSRLVGIEAALYRPGRVGRGGTFAVRSHTPQVGSAVTPQVPTTPLCMHDGQADESQYCHSLGVLQALGLNPSV